MNQNNWVLILGLMVSITACGGNNSRAVVEEENDQYKKELIIQQNEIDRLICDNQMLMDELLKELAYDSHAYVTGRKFDGGDYTAVWGIVLRNIWNNTEGIEKVVVSGTMPAFPAQLTGIEVGDCILSFNGTKVKNKMHLSNLIREVPLGQTEIEVIKVNKEGVESKIKTFVLFIDVLGFDKYMDETKKVAPNQSVKSSP